MEYFLSPADKMLRKDLLVKQLEQLAKAVAELLMRKRSGDLATDQLHAALLEYFSLSEEDLRNADPTGIILKTGPAKLSALADLMEFWDDRQMITKRIAILESIDKIERTYSAERAELINTLKQKLNNESE
jgi:hypothetical protein